MNLLLLLALQAQSPPPRPPIQSNPAPLPERYDGKMTISFMRIVCIRAPCPSGNSMIKIAGRPGIAVRNVRYTSPLPKLSAAASDGLNIEGVVTFQPSPDGRGIEAEITPRRVVSGLWKP